MRIKGRNPTDLHPLVVGRGNRGRFWITGILTLVHTVSGTGIGTPGARTILPSAVRDDAIVGIETLAPALPELVTNLLDVIHTNDHSLALAVTRPAVLRNTVI